MILPSNKYKLLVIDIDGTLINNNGSISADNQKALTKIDKDIKICLSTGRAIAASRKFIEQLGLEGHHIFFDGALVGTSDLSSEIYRKAIDQGTIKQVIDFSRDRGIEIDLYSASRYFIERESWSSDIHSRFFDIEPTICDFTNLWKSETIIKIGMVTNNQEDTSGVSVIHCRFNSSLHFSYVRTPSFPGVDFVNIVAPGVSKGKALIALASHLGIKSEEIIAIGDGLNDIPLLSSAGLGIAMGNAPNSVKEVADEVTLDVEHNGLAAAIEKFLVRIS